jgi:hypothetical protein
VIMKTHVEVEVGTAEAVVVWKTEAVMLSVMVVGEATMKTREVMLGTPATTG